MKLGSTQRTVLENVAAGRAPYAGHKSYAEYTRRMDVARQLVKRGLLRSLPVGHPGITGSRPDEVYASMYRLTPAGEAALGRAAAQAHGARKKRAALLDREIAAAIAGDRPRRDDGGIFYLTDTRENPLGPEFRTRAAAKRAAMKLVREGTHPRVEVWHRWRGDRYMQGLASDEGWSDV